MEQTRKKFIHTCLDGIILNKNINDLKYTVERFPEMFKEYNLIVSDNHNIDLIDYLYNSQIYINWGLFMINMCSTDNIKIVKYLFEKYKDIKYNLSLHDKFIGIYRHFFNIGSTSYYDIFYKDYIHRCIHVAVIYKKAKIYKYFYDCLIAINDNACDYIWIELEKFFKTNYFDTLKWMQDNNLKFCASDRLKTPR